ncbi:MAG: ubiquinone biosynthesis regulatory protein kinase UbiB, partial [Sulfurifustaceae bacterium]
LLQKTLFNIEGLGRRLYPDLDLWVTAKPYLERWARANLGPRALLRALREEAPKWWSWLPRAPGLVYETLQRAHEAASTRESTEIARLREQLRENERRNYLALAGGGFLLAAALLSGFGAYGGNWQTFAPFTGAIVGIAGAWLLWRGRPGQPL